MTLRSILITDVETTGLDPATCQTIEVAAVLFDVAAASVVESFSSLIHATGNAAESINRIRPATLARAPESDRVWAQVGALIERAGPDTAFMAHRADFDRGFYPTKLAASLPWICSKFDVEWPRSALGASLVDVALAHGVPVHANHRALTDCMLLVKVLERTAEMGGDLSAMLTRAMRPKAMFRVSETGFNEARNALAKAAGFRWEKPHWVRSMPPEDAGALPFEVTRMSLL